MESRRSHPPAAVRLPGTCLRRSAAVSGEGGRGSSMDRAIVQAARKRARAKPSARALGTVRPDWKDACGCAMGARFLAAALLISTVWYAWLWESSHLSVGAVLVRVSVWLLLAPGAREM